MRSHDFRPLSALLAQPSFCIANKALAGGATDAYTARRFQRHSVKRRDPMFITAAGLIELESFPTIASLVKWCQSASLAELTKQEQWIFDGQSNEDVHNAFERRIEEGGGVNPSMKTPEIIAALKEQRRGTTCAKI